MKKIVVIFSFLVIILIAFNLKIGGIEIGEQSKLKTFQNKNFEESSFFKDTYSNNKLTVINLWATWCKPCVGEMPELNLVKEKFKNDSINFLSLSIDNDSIKLLNFLKKDKFKFKDITFENLKYRTAILNILEGRKADESNSIQSVPITYLIKNNKILERIDGTIEKNKLISLIKKHK